MAKSPVKTITGKAGPDNLRGTDGVDAIDGKAGDDIITGLKGDDILDGGLGIDTAVFSALTPTTAFTWLSDGSLRISSAEGVDTLSRFEKLTFGTTTYDIQGVIGRTEGISTGENAAQTFALLNNDVSLNPSAPVRLMNKAGGVAQTGDVIATTADGKVDIILQADGRVTFNPGTKYDNLAAGAFIDTTFTYKITNGSFTDTVTDTIRITGVDDLPAAVLDAVSVAEDAFININVLGNDTDIDGGPKAVDTFTQGNHGTVSKNTDGTLKYTPAAGFSGTDSFTYKLNGGSQATVTVTVTTVDDMPVAVEDTASTNENTAVNINVIGNDTDVDGGPKEVEAFGQGAHGTVSENSDGTLAYTPTAGFSGQDAFTYKLNGGSEAIVTVTVVAVNESPTANPDAVSIQEDALEVTGSVLANDTDPDADPLSVVSYTRDGAPPASAGQSFQGKHGTLLVNAPGGFSYVLDPNNQAVNALGIGESTTDVFDYAISDGQGGTSSSTLTITINGVDDTPVANADAVTVDEDSSIAVNVLANDTDVDGGPMTVAVLNQGAHGTVTENADGTLQYTPDADFFGTDTFTYELNGGSTATVSVKVNNQPDNQSPTGSVLYSTSTITETISGEPRDLTASDITNVATQVFNPDNGHIYEWIDAGVSWSSALTSASARQLSGVDGYLVTLTNGSENQFVYDAFKGHFEGRANVPWIGLSDTNQEGTWKWVSGPEAGQVVTYSNWASGEPNNVDASTDGSGEDFAVLHWAGSGRWLDYPTGYRQPYVVEYSGQVVTTTTREYTVITADTGTLRDLDGLGNLDFQWQRLEGNTWIDIAGVTDQTFKFLKGELTGSVRAEISYIDGKGNQEVVWGDAFAIDFDHDPVAVSDNVQTNEDQAIDIDVLANDDDDDGGPKTVVSFSQGANGSVSQNENGTLRYTPNANFFGSDAFTYELNGGSTAAVNVTVNDVPEPKITLTAADISNPATQFFNPANNHIYEFVNTGVRWDEAMSLAASKSLGGASGHLVTITSAQENDFIVSHMNLIDVGWDRDEIWIGASDKDQEGVWRWMAGPEAGTLVSSGYSDWGYSYNPSQPWPETSVGPGDDYAALTTHYNASGEWFHLDQEWFSGGSRTWENGSGSSVSFRGNGYVIEYELSL